MTTKLPVASILPQEDIEEGNNSSNSDETLIIENSHMQPVVYAQSIVEAEPVSNEIVDTVFNELTYSVFNNNFTDFIFDVSYILNEANLNEAQNMLSDPEMKEFALEEIEQCKLKLITIEDNLQKLLLPKDPNDEKNISISKDFRYASISED
jgi:hypothetical protein